MIDFHWFGLIAPTNEPRPEISPPLLLWRAGLAVGSFSPFLFFCFLSLPASECHGKGTCSSPSCLGCGCSCCLWFCCLLRKARAPPSPWRKSLRDSSKQKGKRKETRVFSSLDCRGTTRDPFCFVPLFIFSSELVRATTKKKKKKKSSWIKRNPQNEK